AWDRAKDGMRRASEHVGKVDPGWKDEARMAIFAAAKRCKMLIIDDVHDQLKAAGVGIPSNSHACALGHLMTEAKDNGYIESTGKHRRSGRPSSHADMRPMWKSNVFDANAPLIALVDDKQPRLCHKCGGNRFVVNGICKICIREQEAKNDL